MYGQKKRLLLGGREANGMFCHCFQVNESTYVNNNSCRTFQPKNVSFMQSAVDDSLSISQRKKGPAVPFFRDSRVLTDVFPSPNVRNLSNPLLSPFPSHFCRFETLLVHSSWNAESSLFSVLLRILVGFLWWWGGVRVLPLLWWGWVLVLPLLWLVWALVSPLECWELDQEL